MNCHNQDNSTSINIKARDDRFFRAAESVLQTYKIIRREQLEDGLVIFDIIGGSRDYVVKLHPEWRQNPQCSCPDAFQRAKDSTRGYCKHIIGTLLANPEFHCQLLEAFL